MFVPTSDMPAGFAQSLAQHPKALNSFGQLASQEKVHYIQRAHQVSSKEEMLSLISELDHSHTL